MELVIRRWTTKDAKELIILDDSPREHEEKPKNIQKPSLQEFIKGIEDAEKLGQELYVIILRDKGMDKIIGECVFRDMEPKENKRAYIDYYLDKKCQGKGYGTIVLKLMKELAIKKGIHKLLADPSVDNKGSRKVLEKNGFKLVGILEQHEKEIYSNKFMDKALYEILL